MKNFKFIINGNNYEVNIVNYEENIAELEVNGTPYKVELEKSLQISKTPKLVRPLAVPSTDSTPSTARTSKPVAKGITNVKSFLPGVILDVCVKVGDTVKVGQKLIVLEAMKMENNVDSDKEGTIVDIKVNRGDTVMEGDVLIVIGD